MTIKLFHIYYEIPCIQFVRLLQGIFKTPKSPKGDFVTPKSPEGDFGAA